MLAAVLPFANVLHHVPLKVKRAFRQDDCGGANRDADIDREMTRVSAHDLDHAGALVALHRVRKLVDGVDCGVCRGIKADGIMRAGDVVVNRARNANGVDAVFGKLSCAAEGAVPADGNHAVDSEVLAVFRRALHAFVCAKFFAAGGIENRAAA
ncbi:hypothetical protein SDC9_178596 [bioreactor metagenome]|uniref:Uncharacterized protein n=1 Tax=bioreactor metagenome TaxID=1076179 RepID=A0A645GYJ9_9ZZZZ